MGGVLQARGQGGRLVRRGSFRLWCAVGVWPSRGLNSRKVEHGGGVYRGISLIRNCPPLGPYIRPMPRVLWWS